MHPGLFFNMHSSLKYLFSDCLFGVFFPVLILLVGGFFGCLFWGGGGGGFCFFS